MFYLYLFIYISCSAISLWSALKKKPISTTQLAHGKGDNGVANWITAIAVVVNTDLVATGATADLYYITI